jgi:hypothetical protein
MVSSSAPIRCALANGDGDPVHAARHVASAASAGAARAFLTRASMCMLDRYHAGRAGRARTVLAAARERVRACGVLSIVIPAYAEARFLAGTLRALHAFLGERAAATEVIVVTAEARDGTPAIAARELARFPRGRQLRPGQKVGKGRDVRAGMLAARGDVVLFMDADLATPLHHIDAAIEVIDAGADVAIGCRDIARMHREWGKAWSSRLANALVRAALLPGIGDTQCGFKAFRGAVVRPLFEPLTTLGWGFDLEVLARARGAGLSICELPVPDWADPKGDLGLAGELQWWARLRTLSELAGVVARLGRQRVQAPSVRCTSEERGRLP